MRVTYLVCLARDLERKIESGSLKLVDEKKALADISASKRSRRAVEGFQAEQESIDADRARADELRKQLVSSSIPPLESFYFSPTNETF